MLDTWWSQELKTNQIDRGREREDWSMKKKQRMYVCIMVGYALGWEEGEWNDFNN